MDKADLSADALRARLSYDQETGIFTWRRRAGSGAVINRRNALWAGKAAGNTHKTNGYVIINIDGSFYRAHRLAWLYVYGGWPAGEIDHVNMNRADNRLANLRQATKSQNMSNRGRQADNVSGHKGVYRHKFGRWHATIKKNKKKISLGYFDTAEEAAAAYATAAAQIHGDFARTR